MNITKQIEEHFIANYFPIKFRLEHNINLNGSVNHVLYGIKEKAGRPDELFELDTDFSILGTNATNVSAIDADITFVYNIIDQVTSASNIEKMGDWGFNV